MRVLRCPTCSKRFQIPENYRSATVGCPECDETVSIRPSAMTTPPPSHPSAASTHCRSCGKLARRRLLCPACDELMCSELCLNRHLKLTGHQVPTSGCGTVAAIVVLATLFISCAGLVGFILILSLTRTPAAPTPASAIAIVPGPPSTNPPQAPLAVVPDQTANGQEAPLVGATPAAPTGADNSPPSNSATTPPHSSSGVKTENVRGYTRKDGTQVRPYTRSHK
jgi:hypothetical protein